MLVEQLIDEYESFTTEHCGEFKQCTEGHDQPQQERMTWYHEQIEMAKEENNTLRMLTHLIEF